MPALTVEPPTTSLSTAAEELQYACPVCDAGPSGLAHCNVCGIAYAEVPLVHRARLGDEHRVCPECGVDTAAGPMCETCGCAYPDLPPTRADWSRKRGPKRPSASAATTVSTPPARTPTAKKLDIFGLNRLVGVSLVVCIVVGTAVPAMSEIASVLVVLHVAYLYCAYQIITIHLETFSSRTDGRVRRHIPQHVKETVMLRDGGRCVYCGSAEQLEFDHVIPHSRGGADTVGNLQILCLPCNRRKRTRV